MLLVEKYALQNKQREIDAIAKEIYDKVLPIAKSLYLLNEAGRYSYSLEADRLYRLMNNGDKTAKYILELDDYLQNEDDEAIVFRKVVNDISEKPIYIRAFIVGYETNQTGGFDPRDKSVSVYFSFKQYAQCANNFDLNRLKKTLTHELTHAVDYMNSYYTTKARRVIPMTLSEKDRKMMNDISPYIYDVLYRLWNDSEMNAQQITINDLQINALRDGIDALKKTDPNHEVFSMLRKILPPTREHISDNRFKTWFVANSENRFKKLLSKKSKNDLKLDAV